MFKKICFLLLTISTIYVHSIAFANTSHPILTTYAQFLEALSRGDKVKAIIDNNKCTPPASLMAGISFDQFIQLTSPVNGKSYIATSNNSLININRTPDESKDEYAYDHSVVRIYEDGSVEIIQQFLNPRTYVPMSIKEKKIYACHLNNNDDKGGVTLYNVSLDTNS